MKRLPMDHGLDLEPADQTDAPQPMAQQTFRERAPMNEHELQQERSQDGRLSIDFGLDMPEATPAVETEQAGGRVREGLGNIWAGIRSTPEVVAESVVGTIAYVPAWAAQVGRLGYGRVTGEDPEQTLAEAESVSEATFMAVRDALYLNQAPEMSPMADEAMQHLDTVFSAPSKYVFGPVGDAYGRLVRDEVAGKMSTEAMEFTFFFGALPKLSQKARNARIKRGTEKAWENAYHRYKRQELRGRLRHEMMREGKTRQEYMRDTSIRELFGEEAARRADIDSQRAAEVRRLESAEATMERLRSEEHQARQKVYEKLFDEETVVEYLKDVEDFARRRDLGVEGKITAAELELRYEGFVERMQKRDLEFRRDWERWEQRRREVDLNKIEPAPYDFMGEAGMIARAEGTGARTDLKFGIKTGRPWPQEPIQGRGVVHPEQQPRQLREVLGHTTDRSLKQKMAVGSVKANRQRARAAKQKAQQGDPLATGKVKPVNDKPAVQRDPQMDAMQGLAKEVMESEAGKQGVLVRSQEPPDMKSAPIEPPQAKAITKRAKEQAYADAQIPKTRRDATIEQMTQAEKVQLIKQRHELLKKTKGEKKLRDQIDSADLPPEEAAFYREMVAKDPDFVADALRERKGVKRTTEDTAIRAIDDMLDFMDEPRRTDAKLDSYFLDVMDEGMPRPLTDMINDFNTFLGEKGALDPFGKLGATQKAAAQRLAKDIQIIQRNAGKAGKTIAKYLEDMKLGDPEINAAIERYANDILQQDQPIVMDGPTVTGQARRKRLTRSEAKAKYGVDPTHPDAINKMFDRLEKVKKRKAKQWFKDAAVNTFEVLFARDYKARKALEGTGTPEALAAVDSLIAVGGASVKAKYHWATINKNVFGHLKTPELKALNELVHVISEGDILRRHPNYRVPRGTSREAYHTWAREAPKHLKKRHKLTDESIRRVEQAARDYFDSWDALREMKYQSGAIPKWLNDLLAENKYSPSRWMYMDHAYQNSTLKGNPMSSNQRPPTTFAEFRDAFGKERPLKNESMGPRDTGIQRLKGGLADYKETNARLLLAEGVSSTHNWVAKNEATKSLGRVADIAGEKGPYVRPGKIKRMVTDKQGGQYPEYAPPPKGFRPIHWYEGGHRKTMYAADWFANQWKFSGSEFRQKYAGLVRALSFAPVLRTFATGPARPFFFTVGMPMDIFYTYARAQKKMPDGTYKGLYSINPVTFTAQMGRNLAITAKDAFTRKGRFMDFINEDGAFNAITEQGTSSRLTADRLHQKAYDNFNYYGSYLNATSEYWVRLANREQYIREGYTPKQATIRARDNLDYSQGGELVKFMDNAYPYTNVAMQAFRGLGDAAKKNPGDVAMRVGVLSGIASLYYAYNKLRHPESYEGISDYTKDNYLILPTGFHVTDPAGNKRYISIKQRLEPSMVPVTSLATMVTAAMLGEEVDFKRAFRGMSTSMPVLTGSPVPPSIAAFMTYRYNVDMLSGDPVWRGAPAGAEEWNADRTYQLYRDIFAPLGMSPERGRAGIEAVITRDSLPAKLVGTVYDKMFADLPKAERETFIAKFMLDNWGKDIFAISSEPGRYRDTMHDLDVDESGRRMAQNRILDAELDDYYRNNTGDFTPIREFIRSQPYEDGERLLRRVDHYVQTMNLPYQDMWMMLSSARSEKTKAEVYHQWWSDSGPEKRREIEKGLTILMDSDTGIIPKDLNSQFWERYYQLRIEERRDR